MPLTVVNSQSQLQARLPKLPSSPPSTPGAWTSFTNILRQWAQALQQPNHSPNVIPAQFQTFSAAANAPMVAALTAVNCTPGTDTSDTYYGSASLGVTGLTNPATLQFTGTPISINPATRWFCAFQILALSGCTGSLSVITGSGHTITESFTVPPSSSWQQVWGLFDLSAFADVQATWKFTFTSTAVFALDGMQMNAVGKVLGTLPPFTGTKMVLGASAYAANLDGVPDGSTYARTLSSVQTSGVPDPSKGGVAAKGSTPPILLGNSFSWTTPSGGLQVTITWSAFTIYRSDGTTTAISGGSQTVTGLVNATNYTVYPFIPEGTTTINFAVGFSGAVGTPAMCYAGGSAPAAADMYANNHIPLQNFIVTPNSGGGGGGGGGFGCLHPDTAIELANGKTVLAKQLAQGAVLHGFHGPTKITSIVRQDCFEWARVYFRGGSSVTVTLDHVFIRPDQTQIRASALCLGNIIEGRKLNLEVVGLELLREKAELVAVNVESPHLYYVGGALSHNGNPKP